MMVDEALMLKTVEMIDLPALPPKADQDEKAKTQQASVFVSAKQNTPQIQKFSSFWVHKNKEVFRENFSSLWVIT